MKAWLYQMVTTPEPWNPEIYRVRVWEGQRITWPHLKVTTKRLGQPSPGDLIILFFAKSNTKDHGIFGWGVVTKFTSDHISFRLLPPSDYLKASPCWDKEVDRMIDVARAPIPRGTMWVLDEVQLAGFRRKIRERALPSTRHQPQKPRGA